MIIKITESQYDIIRFRRRLDDFDAFIKESEAYREVCEYNDVDKFIGAIYHEVMDELYSNEDVSQEFIKAVENYLNSVKTPELYEYWETRCLK